KHRNSPRDGATGELAGGLGSVNARPVDKPRISDFSRFLADWWGGIIARVEIPRSRDTFWILVRTRVYKPLSINELHDQTPRHHRCFSVCTARRRALVPHVRGSAGDGAFAIPFSKVPTVRLVRSIPVALLAATIVAGCQTETKQRLATVSHADSVHVDSL